MKIFNQLPQYIYMSDTDGAVYRARVTEINHDYGLAYGPGHCPEITIKCTDLIFTWIKDKFVEMTTVSSNGSHI